MKEYNKPLIDVVRERAEGVYATSGTTVAGVERPKCGSDVMSVATYRMGNGAGTTYVEYYGCAGCHNSNNNGNCALAPGGEYDQRVAKAIAEGSGTPDPADYDGLMPTWESRGYDAGSPVIDLNCWAND